MQYIAVALSWFAFGATMWSALDLHRAALYTRDGWDRASGCVALLDGCSEKLRVAAETMDQCAGGNVFLLRSMEDRDANERRLCAGRRYRPCDPTAAVRGGVP